MGGVLQENINSRQYSGIEVALHAGVYVSWIYCTIHLTTVHNTINKHERQYERFIRNQTCHVFLPTISSIHDFGIRTVPVYVAKSKISSSFHCAFFPVDTFTAGGALYNHNPTNIIHPTTVTATPEIHGHAALMTQLRGHSSCAKWRTVTVVLSSILERKGRRNSTRKLKIPCWSGNLKVVLKTLDEGFVLVRSRDSRWKGESIENSSCTSSSVAGMKGTYSFHDHSDNSIE